MKKNTYKKIEKIYVRIMHALSYKKKKLPKPKVVLNLSSYSYLQLLALSKRVHQHLIPTGQFPLPPETLKSLEKATDELEQAIRKDEMEKANRRRAA